MLSPFYFWNKEYNKGIILESLWYSNLKTSREGCVLREGMM